MKDCGVKSKIGCVGGKFMGNMFFSSSGLISTPTGSIIACGDSLSGASENSSLFANLHNLYTPTVLFTYLPFVFNSL